MFLAAPQEIVYSIQHSVVLEKFDRLAAALQKELSEDSLITLLDAVQFAAEKHEGQTRKDADATPYIVHPIGVCLSLWEEGGVHDVDTLVAALLHDTLEDTAATKEEIADRFGSRVSEIVSEVTNPGGLTSEESKAWQVAHAPTLSLEARLVKLADRLYNVRDLAHGPAGWSQEKIDGYYGWGQKLLDVLKGTNAQLEALLQETINNRSQIVKQ